MSARPLVVLAALIATLAIAHSGSSARPDEGGASAAGCPKGTDPAVIGGKRVCLRVGIKCDRKYQAQYVRLGYSCSVRGRLGLLVCTGASHYAVIGGVHGCLRVGQACQQKYQAQYRKLGFECERARLIRPKPINPRITVTGPEEILFDWSSDRCEDLDIPDLPARAFRDADGNVQLLASHYSTRRLIGPDFDHLAHDCTVVLGSSENPDPAAFDDKQWLGSVYTTDGRTIYGLAHVEYQGNAHPGHCPSADYFRCWWNTLALVVSTDGGRSYRRQGPRNGLVAAVPYRYEPDLGVEGHRGPSQIVRNPADGYYYAIVSQDVLARPGVAREGGNCLIRTRNLADPTSWRAQDESGAYTRSFIDPYTEAGSPREHLCGTYIQTRPGGSPLHPNLTWNAHLKRWLLVGGDQVDVRTDPTTTKWGVYFSVSKDLVTWETQRLVFARNMAFVHRCGDPDPIMYPTVIDHTSSSRSFETSGSRAYLYYTVQHYEGCQQTLDRDLVRVPIAIAK
jgi:hypothetical protein